MIAKIKGLDAYNSNAWRKNLSNWRNQNLRSRLKRVVKGLIWFYDVYTKLYRTDIKDIQLNRKQRQSVKRIHYDHTRTN